MDNLTTGLGEFSKVFFETNLQFHEKSPIIASIGYLILMSTLPLIVILKYAQNMKALDNARIKDQFDAQIKFRQNNITSSSIKR